MAHALKFHAVVSGKTLPLPDLSAFDGKRVEVIVVEAKAEAMPEPHPFTAERHFGTMAGQFTVPDDFDTPLPAAILGGFEGTDEA